MLVTVDNRVAHEVPPDEDGGRPVDLAPVNQILGPVRDLGEFIRDQRQSAQLSLRALAARAGISNPYLSQVERGLRRPSADILAQIAAGLSISAESLLTRAGVLPARPESDDATSAPVITSIRGDAVLSDRQKEALIDIYTAFVAAAPAPTPTPTADLPGTPSTDLAPDHEGDHHGHRH